MAYNPKSDRFNENAVADAQARHAARLKLKPTDESADEEHARSILDEFPSLLHIQNWSRHFPAWTPPGARPRQRPQ